MAHLSVLLLLVFLSEVHPFSPVVTETVAVDIVTPQELEEKKPEPAPEPKAQTPDPFSLSAMPEAPKSEADKPDASKADAPKLEPFKPMAAKSEPSKSEPAHSESSKSESPKSESSKSTPPAAPPQKQAARATPRPDPQPPAQPEPPASPSAPDYLPPEPDLSVKYHVRLGLPPDLSPGQTQGKSGDGFDDEASKSAEIASDLIAAFRRHLRTCSKLPESIAPSDRVKVKLRALMSPDGRLLTDPILIEASASMKGPELMQSAVAALKACQPYAMLPADRYGEWKVLDLSFTPQDFAGG